jgi:hypothetical protein
MAVIISLMIGCTAEIAGFIVFKSGIIREPWAWFKNFIPSNENLKNLLP